MFVIIVCQNNFGEKMNEINRVQAQLSILQAIPIAGPLVYSPIKAVVSIAQIVGGVAQTAFYGMQAPLVIGFGSNREIRDNMDNLIEGLQHIFWGTIGLEYSTLNIATFGIAGFFIETVFPFNTFVVLNRG